VVVDASGISSYSVYPLYSPYRLVIDFIKETPPPAPLLQGRRIVPAAVVSLPRAAAPPPLRSNDAPLLPLASSPIKTRPVAAVAARTPPSLRTAIATPPPPPSTTPVPSAPPTATTTVAASTASTTSSTTTTTTAPVVPAQPNIAGGFSMARQLGLGVSRIVIDPGHGGHDPGGVVRGTTEAAIVLDVALRLEKLLAKVSGVEVLLTRRADEFLTLQERTAIANREGADLFLSIHANANNNTRASGVETYFLNFATNASAAAIAARENATSGQAMGALPDFVKTIALNNKMDESRDFATFVQRSMVETLTKAHKGLKDLGVKQAPFVVLIGATMPSVLAEISFLTNTQEARLLRTTAYRQKIAEALFEAIRKYQTSLKTETKVATQQ
jgi:N-acetylmuramoyl-L-alanine amidase